MPKVAMNDARRSLLCAVRDRAVTWYAGSGDSYRDDVRPARICTKDMGILHRVGLVKKPNEDEGVWTLTDAGWEVLEG